MARVVSEKEADEIAKEGGLFAKLNDGDVTEGIFRGEPCVVRVHWTGKDCFVCPETDECSHCKNGYSAQSRFGYAFIEKKGENFSPKILDLSKRSYNRYSKIRSKHGKDCIVEIERDGTGTETVYMFSYKATLSQDQIKCIEALKLPELEKVYSEKRVATNKG